MTPTPRVDGSMTPEADLAVVLAKLTDTLAKLKAPPAESPLAYRKAEAARLVGISPGWLNDCWPPVDFRDPTPMLAGARSGHAKVYRGGSGKAVARYDTAPLRRLGTVPPHIRSARQWRAGEHDRGIPAAGRPAGRRARH